MKLNDQTIIIEILNIAIDAGKEILKIYDNEIIVNSKQDKSPITQADIKSNNLIISKLKKIESQIPILSEESLVSWENRKKWNKYWLIDPLDGTKEFINRNGEFTVNIALIVNDSPVFGGIYVPVKDVYYFGVQGEGAFKKEGEGELTRLNVNQNKGDWIVVGSKSHAKPAEREFYEEIGVKESFSVGSSLKFCMVAEGVADLYYRSGPTMEWDIAAGHAIVRAAGGEVFKDLDCKEVFTYNKENLLNGPFLATSTTKLK